MKRSLFTTLLFGVLFAAGAGPSPAAGLLGAGAYRVSQADSCRTSCRANADACRAQCSDPEEQTQCIVECDKAKCVANCNHFEDACKQHCPNPGG